MYLLDILREENVLVVVVVVVGKIDKISIINFIYAKYSHFRVHFVIKYVIFLLLNDTYLLTS